MSHHLWRYFLEDDVEGFKKFLNNAKTKQNISKSATTSRGGPVTGSPGLLVGKNLSTSPAQTRKSSGTPGKNKSSQSTTLSKVDINLRDINGLTLLHCIASSRSEHAWEFAQALLEQPLIDLAVQDSESSWTALHRALYFGNITIARSILSQDTLDARVPNAIASGTSFKIKDREGNSPFDLLNYSIAPRTLALNEEEISPIDEDEDQDEEAADGANKGSRQHLVGKSADSGDELFVFGSNKNLNLGVGDEDDRQYPERVVLKRPTHLLQRLRLEHMNQSQSRKNRMNGNDDSSESIDLSGENPAFVQFKPIEIRDVQLSKLHTAIVTDDPEANLYTCGFGPGGRLGTGDEATRFSFSCVYGGSLQGQKIESVGLGQDHTLAITAKGELMSWGSNRFGQLGYALSTSKDEDPMQLLPRQIFGPLKRERVLGCTASRIHSVAYTATNLYTFGKNEGQLGLVDSDARSLDVQTTPRAVAASLFQHSIVQVTAIDKATACLLENTDVWVFANYGYTRVKFPMDDFTNHFLRSTYSTARFGSDGPNHIVTIGAGGDTISARAHQGQVYALTVSRNVEPAGKASTTNPAKIKNALSEPKKVWSPRKETMACVDVDIGQDGSIIICTKSGSVWRRVNRIKAKDAKLSGASVSKPKDYKFSRVPSLTCIHAVRSNAYGSFAAIRNDWNVMKTQIRAPEKSLWKDCFALFPFVNLAPPQDAGRLEIDANGTLDTDAANIRRAVLKDKDIESTLKSNLLNTKDGHFDVKIGSSVSDIRIPCHAFLLSGRSSLLRQGLATFNEAQTFSLPGILNIEYDESNSPLIILRGIDILTLFNLVLFLYTDNIVDVWHYTRFSPEMTVRYKQIRVELMKIASNLGLKELERAARLQIEPKRTLTCDLERAYIAPDFFEQADIEIELQGASYYAHSALMIQRCPFFEGMFAGLSGGSWVRSRYDSLEQDSGELLKVDLTHIEPKVFDLVLRHLYADTGPEMFDEAQASTIDEFLDLIMEVMAVANELMLDRLSQVCQVVLGKFVNPRNVCQLLNAVAPCSVTTFKAAALEYICLNLELMLENHFLDELDDDLMLNLDQAVRENQDACFNFSHRGDFAQAALLEQYPDLAERLELAQRRRIDSMALRARRLQKEEEEKVQRDSKSPRIVPKSPRMIGKATTHDLLFDMDEDGVNILAARPRDELVRKQTAREGPSGSPRDNSLPIRHEQNPPICDLPSLSLGSLNGPAPISDTANAFATAGEGIEPLARSLGIPWGSTALVSEKLDMKQIMAQADDRRHSNISAGLAAQAKKQQQQHQHQQQQQYHVLRNVKISQKERKKQMLENKRRHDEILQQQRHDADANVSSGRRSAAWQSASSGGKVSLKDVLGQPVEPTKTIQAKTPPAKASTGLTLRQTIPGNISKGSMTERKESASQPASLSKRSASSPIIARQPTQPLGSSTKITTQARPPSPVQRHTSQPMTPKIDSPSTSTPKTVRHISPASEPSLQLSMADILAQQQMEKDVIKGATAKRSLQEIQQEQEFMEWWEAEEKATKARMDAETRATTASASRGGKASRARGRGHQKAARGDSREADGGGEVERKKRVERSRRGKTREAPASR